MKTFIPVMIMLLVLEGAMSCLSAQWVTRGGKNYGIFAPQEAWLKGDSLPYFGSENEWSRRMFEEAPADRFYKRRGQRQILAILDGKPELAVRYCLERETEDPKDPEVHYMLTVAYTALATKFPDEFERWMLKAEGAMQKALELGMPSGRFVAGPRSLLEALYGRDLYQELLAEASPLVHGPMLGNALEGGISCWVRTAGESALQMMAWPADDESEILYSPVVYSSLSRDYTAVLRLDGLRPSGEYRYNILVDGKKMFEGEDVPEFRAGQTEDDPSVFRLAFGGCAGYTPAAEKIWLKILEEDPDALFLLGDNVYVDLPEMPGPFHDYTYYRRYSRPEYRELISRVPVYAIWDDHDAAIDDIWMGPYRDKPLWKQPMLGHFIQNWVNPSYGTGDWPGCWFSFVQSDIEFFMLDGRTYRTCPFGPEPTMLGPEQKSWLLEGLATSEATFKVLVSPVAWADKAKPGSHDTWAGFQDERDEILDLVVRENIRGLLLMSADRHRSEVWEVEWDGPYPLYEFLSSRLTNMHFHDIVPGAIFSYNDPQSFGILEFNSKKKIPEVLLRYLNIDGEEVYKEVFPIGR